MGLARRCDSTKPQQQLSTGHQPYSKRIVNPRHTNPTQKLEAKHGLPDILGAIECTHVDIFPSPFPSGVQYKNRKGRSTVDVQLEKTNYLDLEFIKNLNNQNSNGANDSKFCKYERRTTSDIKYGSNKIVNSCSTKKRKIYKYIF
ncbi:jg17505 [Pararge aegeria aegeria]|uniref:Jg17505 protein n=1 Tax=Pararge aegeria aegeria TaxID=348720 RepID=A0A8S4R6P1_9NEOP|nr:jg17505 [Pararge aegeria aegeria]